MIIYDTDQIYTGPKINISELNPITCYMKHFGNYLYLKFIFESTDDWRERRDANKEMLIAEKKMNYWYEKVDNIADLNLKKKKEEMKWTSK